MGVPFHRETPWPNEFWSIFLLPGSRTGRSPYQNTHPYGSAPCLKPNITQPARFWSIMSEQKMSFLGAPAPILLSHHVGPIYLTLLKKKKKTFIGKSLFSKFKKVKKNQSQKHIKSENFRKSKKSICPDPTFSFFDLFFVCVFDFFDFFEVYFFTFSSGCLVFDFFCLNHGFWHYHMKAFLI